MKRYHVNDSIFDLVSDCIINNNTNTRVFTDDSASGNYWVFLEDEKKDTVTYVLDGGYGTCKSCIVFDGITKIISTFDE